MAGTSTLSRTLQSGIYTCKERYGSKDNPWGVREIMLHSPGTQTTTSYRSKGGEEDDLSDEELRVTRNGFTTFNPQYDRGHEFFTTRTDVRLTHPNWDGWNLSQPYWWNGPLVAVPKAGRENAMYPPERRLSAGEIKTLGSKAISEKAPTAPQASLTTAIGEFINDGLPGLVGHALLKRNSRTLPQRAGEEYLNVEFAWKPLISDLKSVVESMASASQTLRQLVKDSGKTVRRSLYFGPELSNSFESYTNSRFGSSPYALVDSRALKSRGLSSIPMNQIDCTTRSYRKVWFKGAFTYHVAANQATLGKLERYEQQANKLLGTRFNASTAWNLAPWSWLVDWQTDIGDVLSSASMLSEDGLVLRYGYLMSTTVDEYICTVPNCVFIGGSMGSAPTTIYRRQSKERVKATPFGFGLDLQSLSGRQWAILVALGMSKGDHRMR